MHQRAKRHLKKKKDVDAISCIGPCSKCTQNVGARSVKIAL